MASHSQGTSRYHLRSSFSSAAKTLPTDTSDHNAAGEKNSKLAMSPITINTTTTKRSRDAAGDQEHVGVYDDLEQQGQSQGQAQRHMPKRPRLTSKTTTTIVTEEMIVEVSTKAPEGDKKDSSNSTEHEVDSRDEEEAAPPNNASTDDNIESEEESVDFQAIADGPGVRRRLFPEHAPTLGATDGLNFADIVVVKQEQESPAGLVHDVPEYHDSLDLQTADGQQTQLDAGSSDHHDIHTHTGSQASVRNEMTQQPPTSNPHATALAPPPRFTTSPAQRVAYFTQRAALETAIPNMADFMRDLRFEMRRAIVDFAIAIELPDSFEIAPTQLIGKVPRELLDLFVVLWRGFEGPGSNEDAEKRSTEDDDDGYEAHWSATKSMLQVLKPLTQKLYTAAELMEALLGAAITSWVLKKDPLSDKEWKRAAGWATESVVREKFGEEAGELIWQDLHVKILEKQLKKKRRLNKAAGMAEEFVQLMRKLLGIQHTDLVRTRVGVPPALWFGEGESWSSEDHTEIEGRLDPQEEFLENLKWIFDDAIKVRLEMEMPGNAHYRFTFPDHLREVMLPDEPENLRVVLGVLPRVIRQSWVGMIQPDDEGEMYEETMVGAAAFWKEDWREMGS